MNLNQNTKWENDTLYRQIMALRNSADVCNYLKKYPFSIGKYLSPLTEKILSIPDILIYSRELINTFFGLMGKKDIDRAALNCLMNHYSSRYYQNHPILDPNMDEVDVFYHAVLYLYLLPCYRPTEKTADINAGVELFPMPKVDIPSNILVMVYKIILNMKIDTEYPDEVVNFIAENFSVVTIADHSPIEYFAMVNEVATTKNISFDAEVINNICELMTIIHSMIYDFYEARPTINDITSLLYTSVENEKYMKRIRNTYGKYFGDDAVSLSSDIINIFLSVESQKSTMVLNKLIAHYFWTFNSFDSFRNKNDIYYQVYRCLLNDVINLSSIRYVYSSNITMKDIFTSFMNLSNSKLEMLSLSDEVVDMVRELENDEEYSEDKDFDEATESRKSHTHRAHKRTSLSKNVNKITTKAYGKYKDYKDAELQVDSQLSKMVESMKNLALGDTRTEIIEGKRLSVISLLKKILGVGFLYSSFGPVKSAIALVVRYGLKKNRTNSERRKLISELDEEIEIIEEKIEDSKSDGNRKAKYNMMRTRSELIKARDRIRAGLPTDPITPDRVKATFNEKPLVK